MHSELICTLHSNCFIFICRTLYFLTQEDCSNTVHYSVHSAHFMKYVHNASLMRCTDALHSNLKDSVSCHAILELTALKRLSDEAICHISVCHFSTGSVHVSWVALISLYICLSFCVFVGQIITFISVFSIANHKTTDIFISSQISSK